MIRLNTQMMAGSKLVQMTGIDIGEELIRRGWYQGMLLPAMSASMSWLAINEEAHKEDNQGNLSTTSLVWNLQQGSLNEDDWLIVATHICDIKKSPDTEPYVEVLRAYWTTDRG